MNQRLMVLIFIISFILPLQAQNNIIKLPEPKKKGNLTVEEALQKRRSIRDYSVKPISLKQISQLLWAAQGITNKKGYRTAPSAGALYPLRLYLISSRIENLNKGIYKYKPKNHTLEKIHSNTNINKIYKGALSQWSIKNAAANIIFAADFSITRKRYPNRADQYVYQEAGHASQNVYLQAESLNLGTVVIGAIYESKIKKAIGMSDNETPVCLMPIGKVK